MKHDVINSPSHYAEGRKFEPIAVIEDWGLNYHLGNALKYISRAGRKDEITQDLRKAVWYIERYIAEQETPQEEPQEGYSHLLGLYDEIAAANPRDLIPLESAHPMWDSDEPWMFSEDTVEHTAEYYDRDRNREWLPVTQTPDCGWDPTLGPTC